MNGSAAPHSADPPPLQSVDSRWTIVVRAGALGDFVLSLPLLRALCQHPPLCLVTRRSYLDILPPDVRPQATLDVDSAAASCLFADLSAPPGALARQLRGAHVHIFNLPDREREAHLARLGVSRFVWHDPRPRTAPHAALRFLQTANLTVPPGLLTQPLWSREHDGDRLWIHPGSGGRAKNWPLSFFARLAAAWQQRHDGLIMVSFGEADEELVTPFEDLLRQSHVRHRTLVCPELKDLKSALSQSARLYVGNDSGVTHLAAALGIPVVALFRVTDPAVWRPLGRCLTVPHDLLQDWPTTPA